MRWAVLVLVLAGFWGGRAISSEEPDLAGLSAALKSKTPAEAYAAADALADLGIRAESAAPALVQALSSPDVDLRWRAARALGAAGNMKSAEGLIKAASDPEALVRAQSIFALGRLPGATEPMLKTIVQGLADKDVSVRRASVRALRGLETDRKEILPLVLKLLEESDPAIVLPALHTIAEGGADVVPALITALEHPEARYWACLVLAEIGPEAKSAVPSLAKALTDERPEVRLQAVIALGEVGAAAKPAVSSLVKTLDDEFPAVRTAAIYSLGKIGDPSAVDAIAKAEQSDDPFMHALAVWALAELQPTDTKRMAQAVDLLVGMLGGEDRELAFLAARAIVELEPPADVLRPAMEKEMDAADGAKAERIIGAYASLGAKVVPLAIKALQDPNTKRKDRALRVLTRVGPEAAPALPDLVKLLATENPALKTEVLFTIAAIGPQAESAVAPVTEALQDKDRGVMLTAAYALAKIGPAAKESVQPLRTLTASQDKLVRVTGTWALVEIGPVTKELAEYASPLLAEALSYDEEFIRIEAAMSLGDLGKFAASAIPALENSAKGDGSAAVRKAAAEAIKRIKGA
jgi:HEAT repeat protein